jgi:hypothetical protein
MTQMRTTGGLRALAVDWQHQGRSLELFDRWKNKELGAWSFSIDSKRRKFGLGAFRSIAKQKKIGLGASRS